MPTLARIVAGLTATATFTLVACGGDSTTAPNKDLAGRYTLRSVNGAALPATVSLVPDFPFTITAGELTLSSGGSFSQSTTIVPPAGRGLSVPVAEVCTGSWSRSGSRLSLAFDASGPCGDAGVLDATYGASTVTFSDVEGTLVYER